MLYFFNAWNGYVVNLQKLCPHKVVWIDMLWFIQVSVTSLIIIFVMHNLYSFFKETLTVPKIKDMVKRPQQKYETLFRELRSINAINANANANVNATSTTTSSAMSSARISDSEMKNELKRYLMDLNMSQQPQPQPQSQPIMQQTDFMESGSMFKINSNVISNNEFPTQLNSSVFA